MKVTCVTAVVVALPLVAGGVTTDIPDPNAVVQITADELFGAIEGRRDELATNPAELYRVVEEIFEPRLDQAYVGRLVLAKHWRSATPDQRERFTEAFQVFMIRTYSNAVLEFSSTQIQVLPYRPGSRDDRATVRTRVTLNEGEVAPVNYSLRLTDDGWKIWDVIIEGISYIKNYRSDFNVEIRQKGLDAVIVRLEGLSAPDENGE